MKTVPCQGILDKTFHILDKNEYVSSLLNSNSPPPRNLNINSENLSISIYYDPTILGFFKKMPTPPLNPLIRPPLQLGT